jgi:AcrR family transcriptional regulator
VTSESQKRPVNRPDIVRAAARVFRRESYRGSTMQHIAEEVGLHKTSLYHHIESKDSLLLAIAEFAMAEPLQELRTIAANPELDAPQKLSHAVYELVMMGTQRTDSVAVFTMYAQDIADPHYRRLFAQQRHDYGEIFAELVADCLGSGIPGEDPRSVSNAILGMCNWMLHWYEPGHRQAPTEMAEDFSRIAMRMVGHAAAEPVTGRAAG